MANSVASSNLEVSSTSKNNKDSSSKLTNQDSDTTKESSKGSDSKSKTNTDADKNPDANLTKEEKLKRFENEGVEFKAKLIGSELVMEPRGDKMCQSSIQRLKAMIKGLKSHKKRILLKISYNGVKVYDEKTNEILHHHEVPQISYIASDDTDSRTFGYVCDLPNKGHQFICFKTGGPAIAVMSTISSLFEAVLEKKKNDSEELNKQSKQEEEQLTINLKSPATTTPANSHSIDLVGDSGIMDNDLSFSSDINFSKQLQSTGQHHQSGAGTSQLFADSILSYGGVGVTGSGISENIFNDSPGSAWPSGNQNINNMQQSQLNQQQLQSQQQLYQKDQQNLSQQQQQNLYLKQQSFQQQHQQQQQPQSGAANADLLFSDLFFGLSDPIIVGQNDSLVSSKMPLDSAIGATANQQLQHHQQQMQQQQQHQLSFASGSPNSNQMRNQINSSLSSSQSQQQQQIQQQQMLMMQQQQQRMMSSSNNNNSISSNINNNPFDANSSMNSSQLNNSAASIMRPRPSASMQAPQPIPPRTGLNRQSTLNVPNSSGVMSPLSLPRPSPMMQEPAQRHNRSLVHNHSSVSLSDAALTRQFSFNTSPSNQQPISESYADRYSVFNDIDNLPSIFESTSLGNVNSHQDAATMGGRQAVPNSRMSNIQGNQAARSSNFNFNF